MTTPPSFPALPGQTWSVHKRPTFSTRVAAHVSGREVRAALYAQALYEFELTYSGLDSAGADNGLQANSLQALMGLYLAVQGQFGTFIYTDPTDNSVESQPVGQGDGSTTDFTLVRTLGGTSEIISWCGAISAVFLNGVSVSPSAYSLVAPNTLSFTSPPTTGQLIEASFTYGFICRFIDDQEDFENFMSGLWSVDSLKFRSVKP
ncbi:hypothetical protein CWB41_14030 [Methylovirgula ligni]|uniref:Uncharacterized protein (TIGR02217 family) n=1 Tax=Methylovirgula ligni TaxID=569860 RepID=A0A3D9YMQ0_9HYPH|nr:DUF2460 domain-containing protein [Methylovirgula ligni]QAY96712.1 hypothetical protein CWB41_14030 [Methylovirgula ligni]REF83248.1 uncharacterized protein (TIGR02217 family) [Methylovirgula ligni]